MRQFRPVSRASPNASAVQGVHIGITAPNESAVVFMYALCLVTIICVTVSLI